MRTLSLRTQQICPILITVTGLVGAFCNVEMLLTFHENKANWAFLQKRSKLVICQFCIQVTMLAIISAEAWYSIQYQQHIGEDFKWIIILANFIEISFVFFSTTFFILAHEHFKETLSLKLFVSAALCLEQIHGAIYYSALCCTQLTWIFILSWNMAAFCLVEVVVVVFAKPTKYSELQNKSSSNGRQSLVRRMIKGLRNPFVIF